MNPRSVAFAAMDHLWWRFWWADGYFNQPGLYFWAGARLGNVRLWGTDFALQEFVLLENVPRIANRGRELVDQIKQLLAHYGYAAAGTKHDCGELGGLAQSRKRFLLVARHQAKVPPFLYEPEKRPLRAVGDVLGRMPLPGDLRAGPMHRLPALHWKTWVRLAFVEAGSDWRSLQKLNVKDGVLADYLLVPEAHHGYMGVRTWDRPGGTVTSRCGPTNGSYAIADPRIDQSGDYGQLGVRRWSQPTGTVSGQSTVGGGGHAIADPRLEARAARHNNIYRVVRWSEVGPTVTGGGHPTSGGASIADPRVGYGADSHRNKLAVTEWTDPARTVTAGNQVQGGALSVADPRTGYGPSAHHHALKVTPWNEHGGTITASRSPGSGALCVADPRPPEHAGYKQTKYRVTGFDEPAGVVIAASTTGNGAFAVADPRPEGLAAKKDHRYHLTGGHYGVVPWSEPANVIAGHGRHDNGFNNVADPRIPGANDRLVALIVALDGTWHRPFTTFELAGLQSLVDPEEQLELDGLSDSAWRERIGNAVPPEAAEAIAGVMGTTLLLAWSGETFLLSATPLWVRQIAVALSVRPA